MYSYIMRKVAVRINSALFKPLELLQNPIGYNNVIKLFIYIKSTLEWIVRMISPTILETIEYYLKIPLLRSKSENITKNTSLPIYLVGIEFDPKEKNVAALEWERV